MDQYKIEYNEKQTIPIYLNQSYIRGPGLIVKKLEKKDSPLNNVTTYSSNGVIRFEINTEKFIDPFSLYLEFDVRNLSDKIIQLDNSAHSIIKKIEVRYKNNNKILEKIDDYDILQSLYFDLYLTKNDRKKRHKYEGFGYNEWGSNETRIMENGYMPKKSYDYLGIQRATFKNDLDTYGGEARDTISDYISKNKDEIVNETIETGQEDILSNFNKWENIHDGKYYPFNIIEYSNRKSDRKYNVKRFKLPLMLKLLGHGIQGDNFKFIPMKIIGPIYINITLNPHAFFIPFIGDKEAYFFNTEKFVLDNFQPNLQIRYQIENVKLLYDLYEFKKEVENDVYNQIKSNGWFLDYKSFAYINHFYLFSLPTQDGISEFREKTEIKAMYVFFLTNLYEHSPYSRRLARHNKGLKRLELVWNHLNIPEVIQDNDSLTTMVKDVNVDYFWKQFKKAVQVSIDDDDDDDKIVVNKQNFCLSKSLSEIIALYDYSKNEDLGLETKNFNVYNDIKIFDDEWIGYYKRNSIINNLNETNLGKKNYFYEKEIIDNFYGEMEDFQSKTIFTFNFDEMPRSYGQFRNGLKVEENQKFKIRVTRSDDIAKKDVFYMFPSIYTYMYVYVEYYETVVLNINGEFLIGK